MGKKTRKRLKSYNIPKVLQLRDRVFKSVDLVCMCGEVLEGDVFEEFVLRVCSRLPPGLQAEAVRDSCACLRGVTLTEDDFHDFAWRMAGNLSRLRSNNAVLPWSGLLKSEWMPVQVAQVEYDVNRWGRTGATLHLQVLAGQACPLEIKRFWTVKYCRFVATELGFHRWANSRYPFRDNQEFTNFRFYILVKSGVPYVQFDKLRSPASCVDWNRKFIRMRARDLKGFSCPRKLADSRLCFRCFYGQDRCPAAVRSGTLVKKACNDCGRTCFFDPDNLEYCQQCDRRKKREIADERRKEA